MRPAGRHFRRPFRCILGEPMTSLSATRRFLSIPLLLTVTTIACIGCTAILVSEPVKYAEPHEATFVPEGYMPPPDKCRIWLHDRPASQQPPPGDCSELRSRVPPGATLVYGS